MFARRSTFSPALPSLDRAGLFLLVLLTLAVPLLFASPAAAQDQKFSPAKDITVQDAYKGLQDDTLVLVDIRTPAEWAQTGLAQTAIPISMQDPEFLRKLAQVQQEHPGKTIAFICASGNRSSVVQIELARRGYTDIFSVYGGTTGSRRAPGWIREGLPMERWNPS